MNIKQGAGKGDTNRPFKGYEFRSNYDSIFGKKEPKEVDGRDEDFDIADETMYDEPLTKFGFFL